VMVPWWWLLIVWFLGTLFGFMMAAILSMARYNK